MFSSNMSKVENFKHTVADKAALLIRSSVTAAQQLFVKLKNTH